MAFFVAPSGRIVPIQFRIDPARHVCVIRARHVRVRLVSDAIHGGSGEAEQYQHVDEDLPELVHRIYERLYPTPPLDGLAMGYPYHEPIRGDVGPYVPEVRQRQHQYDIPRIDVVAFVRERDQDRRAEDPLSTPSIQ